MKYLIGIGAALLASLWWYHFPSGPTSYVEIEFVAPAGASPINEVSVTSGGDRRKLVDLAPGETKSTRIFPADASDNEVSVFVYLTPDTEQAIGWGGQRYYPPGTAFRTHIQIDQNGKVIAEKSCKLPCSFE
ncbi:hypothetical protein WH50_20130 [Pokkaliibacter plantistimulans]|uniref:Uncharacterized protein n=1 Tax=Pokkaliibacter plantistimulans TaxID=1635171 RepID=A0ABX5LVR1_9GAMM|nr:hypothetical protein [Pokkaliibacter plantistimulans]PXF29553.1 hypothetical protein WH50_20130 [Pokkaliibacter plantistimulans]